MTLPETLEPAQALLEQMIGWAPRALALTVVGLVGLIVTSQAPKATRWLIQRTGLDALAERLGVAKLLYAVGVHGGLATALGRTAQIVVVLITLAVSAELLGLPGVAEALAVLLEFFPRLVTASAVLLAGLFAADVLSRLVQRVGERRQDLESPHVVAKVVYYGVVVVAGALAAEQLGLETALIDRLIEITAACGLAGAALSLALGSRTIVANTLAKHYAQRTFLPGDTVRVGDVEGQVRSYGAIGVFLICGDEEIVLPCQQLIDQGVVLSRGARSSDDK